jgi:hypothetical protein
MRILFLIFLLFSSKVFAQNTANSTVSFTLPSVSLLDLAPDRNSFTLTFVAPTEAGNVITSTSTNNTKWLNFTSAVPPSVTRKITAHLAGTIPYGVNIVVNVANVAGSGAGVRGIPVSSVVLSNTPQTIVNAIGGAYTGSGTSQGYQLTFSLGVGDFSQIRNQTTNTTIVYTLADN